MQHCDRCVQLPMEGAWKDCAGIFLWFEHVDMPIIRHGDEVEYVQQLSDWFLKGTESWTLIESIAVCEGC